MTLPIFDGHNDVLSRLAEAGPDAPAGFLAGDGVGHLDLPRAAAAGFAGGCFAVYTGSPPDSAFASDAYFEPVPHDRALREALEQVALLLRLERESEGRLRIVRDAARPRRSGRRPRGGPARRGRRADRPRPRRAGRAPRGRAALAGARLEPAEPVRDRRPVRVPRQPRPGARTHGRGARAGARVRGAAGADRPLAPQRARVLGRGRAERARRSSPRTPTRTRSARRHATSPTTSCARSASGDGLVGINFHVAFLRRGRGRRRRHARCG